MTAALTVHDPAIAGEMAAEAIRALSHFTLVPPAPDKRFGRHHRPYGDATEVRIRAERHPQTMDQIAR